MSDVHYLPTPNTVEFVIDKKPTPKDKTATAFAICLRDDGTAIFVQNLRRAGICLEIPGGHIETGETADQAAVRETYEETGQHIEILGILGHIRMISSGTPPDGWEYAHPISYQQIYLGRVVGHDPFIPNDECLEPIEITNENKGQLVPLQRIIYEIAREKIKEVKISS